MTIKLLLDEDVHATLAEQLRRWEIDAIHVQEINRKGQSDSQQLAYALEQERCLMTFNVGDFVILHRALREQKREHYGIIVLKHLPIGECLRRITSVLQNNSAEQIKNRLIFL